MLHPISFCLLLIAALLVQPALAQPEAMLPVEAAATAPLSSTSGGTVPLPKDALQKLHELFPNTKGTWAAQQLARMSLEEKIGQLFMVPAWTNRANYNKSQITKLIKQYNIGGIIFMQGGPVNQVYHANAYQRMSALPLLVGQDAEWGVAMRLDSTTALPKQMPLGAIQEDSLLFAYGKELARQCRTLGVHVNFAPVVDVNNNPRNPVINDRSFGEDKGVVARHARMVMHGLQQNGVMACAKHFPGHGDTDTDSHLDLPVLAHTPQRLDSLEFYPFHHLIRDGVQSVMVAHLYIPAVDSTPGRPTTLSPKVVTGLLRDSLDFPGLIFTDALNMKGLSKFYPPGKAELAALLAGNDVLLFPENVPLAVEVIKQAVFAGTLTEAQLDQRVYKILLAKEWLGLHQNRLVPTANAERVTDDATANALRLGLARGSMTLAQNPKGLIPLKDLSKRIAYLQIGDPVPGVHYSSLAKYGPVDFRSTAKDISDAQVKQLVADLSTYETVLVGLLDMTRNPSLQYGVPAPVQDLLCKLSKTGQLVHLTAFGNAYALQYIPTTISLLVAYNNSPEAQQAAAEVVMGGWVPMGRLPVTATGRKPEPPPAYDATIRRFALSARGFTDPARFAQIDTLVNNAIRDKATPGATVLVLKGQDIVYAKGFGWMDTNRTILADPFRTGYDIASVTKVAATTLATMKLYEQGRLDLDTTLVTYLPQLAGTDKANIRIKHLLRHDSGLPAFIPFWRKLIVADSSGHTIGHDSTWLRKYPGGDFTVQIADSLWLHKAYPDSIFQQIVRTPLVAAPGEKVVYSDLGMILLGRILETQLQEPLPVFLQREFYGPMGMDHTAFRPAKTQVGNPTAIRYAPSEYDSDFRLRTLTGYVNDEAAALLGGYAGHAGLFSNTYDMVKLLMLLKNGGEYGGRRYLNFETVAEFTAAQPDRRRGLGFDKPGSAGQSSPTAPSASAETFGHLGFTGTCVWVDPTNDLAYVLLSNRTYPDAANATFGDMLVRTQVMEAIYKGLGLNQISQKQ